MSCGSSGCHRWDADHRHQGKLGNKISLQVVLSTLYIQLLNSEVPKSAFVGTSGTNQASIHVRFSKHYNKHPITPVGLLMSADAPGIYLLRTKANTKREIIPQCEMLMKMYSHMNTCCIFKDFSSYV